MTDNSTSQEPFISRVRIRNYKSIGECDVNLSGLTLLVGRNGAGKSNFIDSLSFVADGLQTSLDHAIKQRGGIDAVRRRSTGHPRNFAIELSLNLPDLRTARYGFEVAARQKGGFVVKQEHLRILKPNGDKEASYAVTEGNVEDGASSLSMPPAVADRLYLVNAAGLPVYRPIYDALTAMGFYNLNPAVMKQVQSPDAGELLHRDGSNLPSVIGRLHADEPRAIEQIREYLAKIVPGVTDVQRHSLGPQETLEFRQEVAGSEAPWRFYAASMSDGTMRALGTLVAVTQLAGRTDPVRLVGIEEPETALHPAAAGALMDALREAAAETQILLTTHSADLLDVVDTTTEGLLGVQANRGKTEIGQLDSASRDAIRQHLYSAGELLRMDQLSIDEDDLHRQRQLEFFSEFEEVG
ncbi:MAG: AAA family ATPase [Pirellulaceae bacterium]